MEFLEHVIIGEGISVDHSKIVAILSRDQPKNAIEVWSFLGLVGYYQRFGIEFSLIIAPLTKLTWKTMKFEWTDTCEQIFQALKRLLTTTPVLVIPSPKWAFCDLQ